MKPFNEEFFDYSTILMRVERIEKELHEACLSKEYAKVPNLANDLMEQAFLIKQWAKEQPVEKKKSF